MANYDIERHVYLMQKQNRLVKMNQHLKNVNKIEWIEYQMYYRMVTSQLWFNDKEIYVQLIRKFIFNEIDPLTFVKKFSNSYFELIEEMIGYECYPDELYNLIIDPNLENFSDIMENIQTDCEILEYDLRKGIENRENLFHEFRFTMKQFSNYFEEFF